MMYLTYALFPQVGLKFLQNRDNPDAFEPVPTLSLPLRRQRLQAAAVEAHGVYHWCQWPKLCS